MNKNQWIIFAIGLLVGLGLIGLSCRMMYIDPPVGKEVSGYTILTFVGIVITMCSLIYGVIFNGEPS